MFHMYTHAQYTLYSYGGDYVTSKNVNDLEHSYVATLPALLF